MGIFDFISDAGAKLFGKDEDITAATKSFSDHLRDNDLDPSNLRFRIGNQTVTVTGAMPSQEDKEKAVLVLGNVQGVAHVDDQIVVATVGNEPEATQSGEISSEIPAATPETTAWTSRTYTVVRGDTLGGIAQKMYGKASKYHEIFEANRPMLKDPDKIYPGQVLRIPDLD